MIAPVRQVSGADEWAIADTPTTTTHNDFAHAGDTAVAVGGDGTVLERASDLEWTTVTDDGVSGNGNNLHGVAATDDGAAVWVVGASGRIGEYLLESDRLVDHSAPNDVTDQFNDVAVSGEVGDADVYVVRGRQDPLQLRRR